MAQVNTSAFTAVAAQAGEHIERDTEDAAREFFAVSDEADLLWWRLNVTRETYGERSYLERYREVAQ